MALDVLGTRLGDERCGLFFLAGLDDRDVGGGALTVHAAAGSLDQGNRTFIEETVAALDGAIEVRFRIHSSDDLHAPDSLEAFSNLFRHDRIVADPTGAFARVSKLLHLARLIRSDLGAPVRSVLWQHNASALVVVATPAEGNEARKAVIEAMIADGCADLKKAIRSVSLVIERPAGRYTPVDAASCPAPKPRPARAGLLARVSGIAALIGLGTLTAAHAATPAADSEEAMMPGITALVDLTTLGENAYGVRNHFQAVGGLRLYFGASGMLKATALRPGAADEILRLLNSQDVDEPEGEPVWSVPTRIAY